MQDPRTGRITQVTEAEATKAKAQGKPVFRVGAIVKLNNGWFKVHKITKKDLVLRGIPTPKNEEKQK